ncbi:MAG: hypothetical protein ABI471_07835 [Sphingomonas bacterium]
MRGPVARYFLARHALSAEDAIPYVPKTRLERWWFDCFRRRGSLHEIGRGNFYFDLIAYHQDAEAIRRRAVTISLPLSLAIAGIAMLFYRL